LLRDSLADVTIGLLLDSRRYDRSSLFADVTIGLP
jgi:hypothetical protein